MIVRPKFGGCGVKSHLVIQNLNWHVAKHSAFFQKARISNLRFAHGGAIQFAGEERFMNVLWILIILKWLSIMVESWQAFEFFG